MQHMYQQARPHNGTAAGEQRADSSDPDTSCDRPCTSPPPQQQQQVVIAVGQPFQPSEDHLNPYATNYKTRTPGLPGPYYQQQLKTTTHPHAEPRGLCVVPIEMPQVTGYPVTSQLRDQDDPDRCWSMDWCFFLLGFILTPAWLVGALMPLFRTRGTRFSSTSRVLAFVLNLALSIFATVAITIFFLQEYDKQDPAASSR